MTNCISLREKETENPIKKCPFLAGSPQSKIVKEATELCQEDWILEERVILVFLNLNKSVEEYIHIFKLNFIVSEARSETNI